MKIEDSTVKLDQYYEVTGLEWIRDASREIRKLRADVAAYEAVAVEYAMQCGVSNGLEGLRANSERYEILRKGEDWPAVFASPFAPEPLCGSRLDNLLDDRRVRHERGDRED